MITASAAELHGGQSAIIDGDQHLTHGELYGAARQFGAALISIGVAAGDRVAIWAPNSLEWVVAFLGLSQSGAVLVPINTRFKGIEAAEVLGRSGARVLVTVTDFLGTNYVELLSQTAIDLPALETIIVIDGPLPEGAIAWSAFIALATDDYLADVDRRAAAVTPDDVSDILFTSGTTGAPKGVVQTHGRTLRVAQDWAQMTSLEVGDRYLMVNPYFHMFGLKAGILASLVVGATMLPEPIFDVDRVLRRVAEQRITVLPGPPTLYQSILEHPNRDQYDLSSVRIAVTGAADIPVMLIRRIIDDLQIPTVIAGYGLTEGGTATATSPDDDVETIATTVGRPRPGFELRIVDSAGNDMPIGESGEILLRSDSIMSHYLDDPVATAEVLSQDGWLQTGDLGVLDRSGCLRIVGRSKDMFIVGGFNAYPAEIENVLLRHPDITQTAVIGIDDERMGEVGMAFVVVRPGSTISSADIIAWARAQMANYKVPRRVEIIDILPLNATGKVMKNVLRQRALG